MKIQAMPRTTVGTRSGNKIKVKMILRQGMSVRSISQAMMKAMTKAKDVAPIAKRKVWGMTSV